MDILKSIGREIKKIKDNNPTIEFESLVCGEATHKQIREAIENQTGIGGVNSFSFQGVPVYLNLDLHPDVFLIRLKISMQRYQLL